MAGTGRVAEAARRRADSRVRQRPRPAPQAPAAGRGAGGAPPPLPAVRVLESAHAVDIVPARISKADVITAAADLAGGSVLAIGDQGQPGGNDFALLAHQLYSLSVD